jgi:DNA gyrase subunit B
MADHPSEHQQSDRSSDYGADQISILEGLEAVRKRPGMYIGDTGLAGLHHLVWEAVDNSIDECMAGRATTVVVRVNADGSVSVADDGSGIPVDPKTHDNPAYHGKPAVELVMTLLHAGGKFGGDTSAYKVSGGLHGVGISCVNALSEWLEVEVRRGGKIHKIRFERGLTSEPLHVTGEVPADAIGKTGTTVTFKPDPQIFPDTEFNHDSLEHRLRELAYLNPGARIRFVDERVGADGAVRDHTFLYNRGIVEYVEHINSAKTSLHDVVALTGEANAQGLAVDIAMQFTDSYSELLLSFANNIRTVDGGTHLSGLKTALTRALNNYARKAGLIKEKDPQPSGDDWREGLTAIVSVKLPEPQFEGQTKGKLRNTEVEGFVASIVSERLSDWLEEHPAEAKKLCQKGVLAAQAREAARRARDLTRRKSALDSGSMPHKLRDCTTKDVDRSELFIVEGDSAGGSATQGRDVETQAILPLRGKLLNVEKARLDKILGFEEIRTLIAALRCGIGPDFDIARLRYGRVIIMTDADVDGSHIRTLLLTFFFRQMPELIRRGRIYIAQPPLYRIVRNKKEQYVINERQMQDVLATIGVDGAKLLIRDPLDEDDATGEPKVVRTLEGEEVQTLVKLLRRLDELVSVAERRGVPFLDLLAQRGNDPEERRRLPTHRITWRGGSAFAWSDTHAQDLVGEFNLRDAGDAVEDAPQGENGDAKPVAVIRELHENRELAPIFERLAAMGVDIEDYGLTHEEAVTGEKLPTKYAWATPGSKKKIAAAAAELDQGEEGEPGATPTATSQKYVEAANIPEILRGLLAIGRQGMEVQRFKGLGEMDPEQLWETTMDASVRTLMRVNWDDASAADELFTVLMGENVERRRSYIENHALEVKQLDV